MTISRISDRQATKSRIPCPNFGESRFHGSSQIPNPVKIFFVFPNPAPYFGQIPDPENTLPDPERNYFSLFLCQQLAICIAFACLADFDRDVGGRDDKYATRFDLFMAVFVIGWVIVLLVFLVFLLGVEGNMMTERNWNLLVSSYVPL